MTNVCGSCTAPSPDAFICSVCTAELRAALLSLARGPEVAGRPTAGLLDALNDVVTRQTCLGGGGGHRKRGDELCDPFEPHAADHLVGGAVKLTRQGQASILLDEAQSKLGTTVRDVLETRGIEVRRAFKVVNRELVGPLLPGWRRAPGDWRPTLPEIANWLAVHVHSLACDESAGIWRREVDGLVKKIEKVIDRPIQRQFLGPCPTWDESRRSACGNELHARADAIEVWCPICRHTHNVNRLQLLLINDLERQKVTVRKILELNRILPEEYRIPERSLRRWRSPGPNGEPPRLKPRGYIRPNGRLVINRHGEEDEPLYLWADVRKLRAEWGRKPDAPLTSALGDKQH